MPEQCAAAIALAFAAKHGLVVKVTPYSRIARLVSLLRDRNLGRPELRRWILNNVEDGDPLAPLMPPVDGAPFHGCVFCVSAPVKDATPRDRALFEYVTRKLDTKIRDAGGSLLLPTPHDQSRDRWRAKDDVLRDIVQRFGRVGTVICLSDHMTGGPGIEMHTASSLKLFTVLVQQGEARSAWLTGRKMVVVKYGNRADRAAQLTFDALLENRWSVLNGERHRGDREIMAAEERSDLRSAWQALDTQRQADLAEQLWTTPAYVDLILGSGIGMGLASGDEIAGLHSALRVPPPGPKPVVPEFDLAEREALGLVAHELNLDVRDALWAADTLLAELALQGDAREHIDDPALWHEYFQQIGLSGPRGRANA